jgi:hypothetical protein
MRRIGVANQAPEFVPAACEVYAEFISRRREIFFFARGDLRATSTDH